DNSDLHSFLTTLFRSKLTFDQDINGTPGEVALESTMAGVGLLVSKNLLIVEPYGGIGMVSADGEMTITASGGAEFYNFTTSQKRSEEHTSELQSRENL